MAPRWLCRKVETDEGISGWGVPVLQGHAKALATKVAELADFVIGQDARRIEGIWQLTCRNGCCRGGPVLMSAHPCIDLALWDIKRRALGGPVRQLLGRAGARRHPKLMLDRRGPSRQPDEGAKATRTQGQDSAHKPLPGVGPPRRRSSWQSRDTHGRGHPPHQFRLTGPT